MNFIICHGYAHRYNTAGVMESAKVVIFDGSIAFQEEFMQRTPESMDLTGGDYSEIEATISRFSFIFQDGQRRTPVQDKKYAQPKNEVVTR